ncbi:amidoligase family protein [Christensenellaceae bacterium OttesenSCG-928-M15]|nr:amidoligase family protein [Christensenellaceae bacterium OttesenSCG-928-M15]
MIDMREQPFGVEIEMTGITREQAAEVLAQLWETNASYSGGAYSTWTVHDPEGKEWKLMSDSSIREERWVSGKQYRAGSGSQYAVELVTPKLTYVEIPKLQAAARALREAHAKVNSSCGLHVHIDASKHDQQSLKNLMSIMYSKEDMLFEALQVPTDRVERWCKPVRENMLQQARRMSSTASMERLQRIWYQGTPDTYTHYQSTRYHALNLHSVFYRGTVEFRMFNSTLHAGRVKSYAQLALAISAQAINQRGAQMRKTQSDNPAFTFRTWLLRMGLIGDEFKTARKLLLQELEGDKSWRYDKDVYEKRNSRHEPER